jgi:hypothetical protein
MAAFFASGRAADLALAALLVEFAWLSLRRRPPALLDRALPLLPGACLLLALRAALVGAPWPWVAAALAASLPLHVADLARRKR